MGTCTGVVSSGAVDPHVHGQLVCLQLAQIPDGYVFEQ